MAHPERKINNPGTSSQKAAGRGAPEGRIEYIIDFIA